MSELCYSFGIGIIIVTLVCACREKIKYMSIGTKSVLFGAHQFLIHPWFVALGWWKLYGFPWNPLLWIAFFVHDLGYIGKPNMDGKEGDEHPLFGARVMRIIAGKKWYYFCLYHSRFLAKRDGNQFSKLCVADKYAIILEPDWLYLPRVIASGEINEYMELADDGKYSTMNLGTGSIHAWRNSVIEYLERWIKEHKDCKEDTWTPSPEVCTCEPYMPQCDMCNNIINPKPKR